jgi:hypothetical protein
MAAPYGRRSELGTARGVFGHGCGGPHRSGRRPDRFPPRSPAHSWLSWSVTPPAVISSDGMRVWKRPWSMCPYGQGNDDGRTRRGGRRSGLRAPRGATRPPGHRDHKPLSVPRSQGAGHRRKMDDRDHSTPAHHAETIDPRRGDGLVEGPSPPGEGRAHLRRRRRGRERADCGAVRYRGEHHQEHGLTSPGCLHVLSPDTRRDPDPRRSADPAWTIPRRRRSE